MLDYLRRKKSKAEDDLLQLEDPNVVLKQEAYDDCLSCRIFGENEYLPK
jgi:hypothetical protein